MSTTVSAVIKAMETIAPPTLAEPDDPIGLHAGHPRKSVSRILVALDATQKVIKQAVAKDCQIIVTHHPRFYRPVKNLDETNPYGLLAAEIVRAGISVYCAHTNLDSVPDGINDVLADMAGMCIERIALLQNRTVDAVCGLGRVGALRAPCTLTTLARRLKKKSNSPGTLVLGNRNRRITRAVVWSGGGLRSHLLNTVNTDVVILGETDYHSMELMEQKKIACIALGHAPCEEIILPWLATQLRRALPTITIYTSTSGTAKMWAL